MWIVDVMPINPVMYKDPDGFHYKHPERNCHKCSKYPCLEKMETLKGNFAAYGCVNYENIDTFEIWKVRK